RAEVEGTESTVLESLEEHHLAKLSLSELERLPADSERFVPKMIVLIESVRHHFEMEEEELFPEVRQALGRTRLREIGDMLASAKKKAPTRPHPLAPDEPPLNTIVSSATALVDRALMTGRDTVSRVRS